MLERETATAWTKALLAFLNHEISGTALARRPSDMPRLPFRRRSSAHYNALRARAEKTVRWLIAEADVAKWRSASKRRRPLHEKDVDPVRRGVEDWLTDPDVITHPDYAYMAIDTALGFDESGRVVAKMPRVRSVDAFVALTIAELLSPDSPVRVKECGLSTCRKLFVEEIPHLGKPKRFCCEAHATTDRVHTHRKNKKGGRAR